MNRRRRRRKGFTIIELVVVAIIIGMLAVFVVPKIGKKFSQAKHEIARAKMAIIESALEEFYVACGRYPDDSEGLDVLLTAPADVEDKWTGPYLKQSELLDPWGNAYDYYEEGSVNVGGYDIVSLGADGIEGGEGENEDIYND